MKSTQLLPIEATMNSTDYEAFCARYNDAELAFMAKHVMLTRPDVAAEAENALADFRAAYPDSLAVRLLSAS